MNDINESFDIFPGSKASRNIGKMELNEIILHIMPNGWSRQVYMQGFWFWVCLKQDINTFENMEIAEYIHEVVVESS